MRFISPQKLFLFSRHLNFCPELDEKDKVNPKFYYVTAWLINNLIHILPNISRSKGKLIEYNMRNIFLEKSYTKCNRKTSPRPFSGKLKLSISLDQ